MVARALAFFNDELWDEGAGDDPGENLTHDLIENVLRMAGLHGRASPRFSHGEFGLPRRICRVAGAFSLPQTPFAYSIVFFPCFPAVGSATPNPAALGNRHFSLVVGRSRRPRPDFALAVPS